MKNIARAIISAKQVLQNITRVKSYWKIQGLQSNEATRKEEESNQKFQKISCIFCARLAEVLCKLQKLAASEYDKKLFYQQSTLIFEW